MRYIMLLKANPETEAGLMPTTELIVEIGKYNEALIQSGVLLDAAGLRPTSEGSRVDFSGEHRIVTDGPFTESGGLIAGYWTIQVKSHEEAVEWAKRCPHPLGEPDAQIELRRIFDPGDFTTAPPELVERELEFRNSIRKK